MFHIPNFLSTCPLRARGIEVTKNDVLILQQFMRSDGSILKLENTNLGDRTYQKVVSCIRQAQREGLLPTDEPEYCVSGAPLVKHAVYSEARYPKGTRIDQWRLTNRGQRDEYWHQQIGHDYRDKVVETDAPRVKKDWPREFESDVVKDYDDPRSKND